MDYLSLKEIQKIEIDILDYIVNVCKENKLRYFLFYGSLIGAVRHNGFIPWDDDIDLAMLKNDYDCFIEITHNNPHPFYKVIEPKYTPAALFPGIKVCDTRYQIEEGSIKEEYLNGIFVDIWPLYKYQENIINLKKIRSLEKRRYMSCQRKFTKSNNGSSLLKLIAFIFFHNKKPSSYNKIILREYDKLSLVENNTYVNSVFSLGKVPFPLSMFEETIYLPFEGKKYACPKDYDKILRIIYGDYTVVPPKNERASHFLKAFRK